MKIYCKPFGMYDTFDVIVDGDEVWVFDEIAGHFTTCHSLSEEEIEHIRNVCNENNLKE